MTENEQALASFERAVLEKLLADEHAILVALRHQLGSCQVASREFTSHGFFTNLHVDRAMNPAPVTVQRIQIRDVGADISGLEYGAGFVLFVVDGYLGLLEGFSYEELWLMEIAEFSLEYEGDRTHNPGAINLPTS